MARTEAPGIETPRLILRRKMEKDIPGMLALFNHEEVRRYLGGYPPRDEASMMRMIRHRSPTQWAVTLRDSGEYIGECLISGIVDDYLGEIGYLFKREYWGSGYALEAVSAIISHGFYTLHLGRLCAQIDQCNDRSIRLIEKLGFLLDASIPEADFGGRVADILYYSLKKK